MSKISDPYVKVVAWSEEDQCYIGRCPGLMLGEAHGNDERAVYAEHHRTRSSREEFAAIVKRHGFAYGESMLG